MSGDDQQFCLRWNDFQTNMVASFKHLRDEKSFCDVTIATEGQHTKAHKMILCACSPYFKNLLEQNPAKHPIIILKDVPFKYRKGKITKAELLKVLKEKVEEQANNA